MNVTRKYYHHELRSLSLMGRSLFAAGRGVLLALTLEHARAQEEESIGTSQPTPDAAAANPPHPSPLDTSASGDGAQPSVSALSAMLQGLDWTNVALTVLVGLAIIVTLISQMPARRSPEHTQGEVKGKSAAAASSEAEEDVEEDVEEDAEEDGEEDGEEKTKDEATDEKPEEKEREAPKGISEAQLLRKMDRLPMWTIVDGRARPLPLDDGRPHFWIDFNDALKRVTEVRKTVQPAHCYGEPMLRVVGMGQALAIAAQGGLVERRAADVAFAKELPCKDNVDWDVGEVPLFVCHGMLQVMPDGKRVQVSLLDQPPPPPKKQK